jgi:hypothetical protein
MSTEDLNPTTRELMIELRSIAKTQERHGDQIERLSEQIAAHKVLEMRVVVLEDKAKAGGTKVWDAVKIAAAAVAGWAGAHVSK